MCMGSFSSYANDIWMWGTTCTISINIIFIAYLQLGIGMDLHKVQQPIYFYDISIS